MRSMMGAEGRIMLQSAENDDWLAHERRTVPTLVAFSSTY
jgi:hypothetical protein